MAERSSELGEEIPVERTETNTVGTSLETTEGNYFESDRDNNLEVIDSSDETETDVEEVSPETEELRLQIEDTRNQMSETIDAIQEKLSFSNISEQVKDEVSEHITSALQTAKDSVYEATLGKVGNIMNYINKGMNEISETDVVRTAKNPLAITLIGLGIGMLAMNGLTKTKKSYRYKSDYDYDNEGDYDRHESSSSSDKKSSTFAAAQGKVGDVAGKVGGTISGAAGSVSDSVTDVAGKAYKQVGNIGSQAKDIAGSAQDQYEYYIEENPLAVGAVALALGAAVGLSIPSSRFEGQLMGETRDNLVEKAQATARETIDKVQQVAGTVTETVKQAAGDLAQNVKDSAGDVTQTVKDEVKKQGLT